MAKLPHLWSPKLRLATALSLAIAIVFLLETVPNLRDIIQPLQRFTAAFAFVTIKAAGVPIAIEDIVLTHPDGFRVAISYGCTPVVPAVFLVSVLTLGLALTWRTRLIALSSGIALVIFLNLFRVAVLYYIGVASPRVFAFAHEWLGQAFIVLGTAIVACYWISASEMRQPRVPAL